MDFENKKRITKSTKWNNVKAANSNTVLKKHRIKTNIQNAKKLRERNRDAIRNIYNIPVNHDDDLNEVDLESDLQNAFTNVDVDMQNIDSRDTNRRIEAQVNMEENFRRNNKKIDPEVQKKKKILTTGECGIKLPILTIILIKI